MALFAPIYALEYLGSSEPSLAWKGFARGLPSWVGPCGVLLSLIALAHFIWFAVHSHWGVVYLAADFSHKTRSEVLAQVRQLLPLMKFKVVPLTKQESIAAKWWSLDARFAGFIGIGYIG
jgi:hypothetical protein